MSVAEYYRHQEEIEKPKVEIDDYQSITPQVIECEDDTWKQFLSEPYQIHGGRSMNFIVFDRGQMLGAILLKNDTVNLKPRDKFIGWKDRSRLAFILRATLATPDPKLIPLFAWLSTSKQCQIVWNHYYSDQHIIGVVTSNLTEDLKYWDYCGEYEYSIDTKPSPKLKEMAKKWFAKKYPAKKPFEMYDILGLKPPKIKEKRKVYFCELYKNTLPFLRNEMETIIAVPAFDNKHHSLVTEWKRDIA